MAVDGHAEVEHDPLPRQLHRPGLEVFGRKARREDAEIGERERVQATQRARGDVAMDRDLHEVRLRKRGAGADDDRSEREDDLPPVRPQVLQEPAHQPRVVRLAEDFVVVQRGIG